MTTNAMCTCFITMVLDVQSVHESSGKRGAIHINSPLKIGFPRLGSSVGWKSTSIYSGSLGSIPSLAIILRPPNLSLYAGGAITEREEYINHRTEREWYVVITIHNLNHLAHV